MARNHCLSLELALLGLCLICHQAVIDAHVLVYRRTTSQLIEEFNDLPASFGPPIVDNNLRVFVVPHDPSDPYGCNNFSCPPRSSYPKNAKFVAIISRGGNCTFERKVRVAQERSYSAVVIYNNEGDELEQMTANNKSGINIPSVFVGITTGKTLLSFFTPEVVLIINDELPFNINTQLILPFSILIALCFLILIVYMIYKCIQEQRRLRRNRLPKRTLNKIPVLRYAKNDASIKYETCVICLEDFVEDDKLRVLPCSHPYHTHCIDPWLTQNRRVCPICKRKVFPKGGYVRARASRNPRPSLDSITDTDDDTTPLLQAQPQSVSAAGSAGSGSNSASINSAPLAENTTRHGTFRRGDAARTLNAEQENQSSDDENPLLHSTGAQASTSSSVQRRVNPFDRAINLPAHLANQLNQPRPSLWSRINFSSLFRRESTGISVAAPAYLDHVEAGTSEAAIRDTTETAQITVISNPTSNNILNPNLSGSFKDDDDMPPHRSIYEPIAISAPTTEQGVSTGAAGVADSEFLQTPTQGGIGVAALPHSGTDRQFLI
ncbi:E3 ubiquitin-protein ligase RNF13 [Drosophila navojoa]|uniref:E3 ubiquitin-protein ligase RNF13 n=1 Tax=Drosophila navojoa TaxID=7232 RepID=UPI000847B94D|nr:E3 ubiquitin-protein ligase RNF13 [Drosophila navojoa]